MLKQSWIVFAILVILSRFLAVFSIYPGNAPDEYGHMTIATALSHGRLLNLVEEREYSGYPYSLYNPMGYLPAAVALKIASWKDPRINEMRKPMGDYSFASNYAARIGNLFWTFLYAFFLILLLKDEPLVPGLLKGALLGFLPQIIFVQSYVNLDAAGLPFFLYLLWAVQNKKLTHLAASVFFIMNCKLNYICTLALPAVCFLGWYKSDFKLLIKNSAIFIGIPMLLGSSWFLYNQFFKAEFGGFSVLHALRTLYNEHPPRWAAISWVYLNMSIKSAFGYFGYMNQTLPAWVYWIWRLVFVVPAAGMVCWLAARRKDPVDLGMGAVFVSNFIIHFYTGFTTFYQPQGRYLFPAITVALFAFPAILDFLPTRAHLVRRGVVLAVLAFVLLSGGMSYYVMSQNPYRAGFGISKSG